MMHKCNDDTGTDDYLNNIKAELRQDQLLNRFSKFMNIPKSI